MNWYAVTIMCMWVCAAIGSMRTKDYLPFAFALVGTVAVGLGYLIRYGVIQ